MKKSVFVLFIMLFTLQACSEEDDQENCVEEETGFISEVNGATMATLNETLQIEVKFPVYNGCGQFKEFVETGTDFNRFIQVKAKYDGCICTQDVPTRTTVYEFTPAETGIYELNFLSGPGEYIVHQIEVE